MKNILLICVIFLLFSCSNQGTSCAEQEQALRDRFADLIELAGSNQAQIDALNQELEAGLARVCN